MTENQNETLHNFSIEGIIELLNEELESTIKALNFYQKKTELISQTIEKLKS